MMYADDNNGWMLPYVFNEGNNGWPVMFTYWSPKYIGCSSLNAGRKKITALRCPSNSSKYYFVGVAPPNDQYYTNHLRNGELGYETSVSHYHKISEVKDPSHMVEFCDGANGKYGIWLGIIDDATDAINTRIGYVHSEGANFIFVDGHCGWHKATGVKRSWFTLAAD